MLCKGWGPWRAAVVAMLLVLPAGFGGLIPGVAQARERADLAPAGTISIAQLPPQGRNMMGLIPGRAVQARKRRRGVWQPGTNPSCQKPWLLS